MTDFNFSKLNLATNDATRGDISSAKFMIKRLTEIVAFSDEAIADEKEYYLKILDDVLTAGDIGDVAKRQRAVCRAMNLSHKAGVKPNDMIKDVTIARDIHQTKVTEKLSLDKAIEKFLENTTDKYVLPNGSSFDFQNLKRIYNKYKNAIIAEQKVFEDSPLDNT